VSLGSLLFALFFGIGIEGDPHYVSAIIALYTPAFSGLRGAKKRTTFSWAGATLMFLMSAQICHALLQVRFPWLAACLAFCGHLHSGSSDRATDWHG
jgi:hypothetical protein